MARTGRPPKPTALKILNGNPGRGPINSREPKPDATPPKCPTWLDAEAKRKWKQLVPHLQRLGLLTVVDGDVLTAYCQAWAEFRQATETLQKKGRYISVGPSQQPHPAVAQQRSAWKAVKEFAALFGLDPSSRSRLMVHPPTDDTDDLEDFLAAAT